MVIPSGNSFLPKLFAIFAHKDGVSSRFTPPGNPDIQTHISSPHLIPSPASFFSKGKVANLQSVARGSCLFSNSFGADVTSPPCCLPVRLHFLYINSSTPARWTSAPLRWFIKRWSVIQTKYCERTSTETHLFFLFLQVSFPSSRGSRVADESHAGRFDPIRSDATWWKQLFLGTVACRWSSARGSVCMFTSAALFANTAEERWNKWCRFGFTDACLKHRPIFMCVCTIWS